MKISAAFIQDAVIDSEYHIVAYHIFSVTFRLLLLLEDVLLRTLLPVITVVVPSKWHCHLWTRNVNCSYLLTYLLTYFPRTTTTMLWPFCEASHAVDKSCLTGRVSPIRRSLQHVTQSVSGTLDRPRVVAPSKTCVHVRSSRRRRHWAQCRPRSAAPAFGRVVLAGASTPAWCPVYCLHECPQPAVVRSGLVSLPVVAARDQKWRVASYKSGLLSYFRTRPGFWPCSSWWYLKQIQTYHVDKQANRHTHTSGHYWKQYHLALLLLGQRLLCCHDSMASWPFLEFLQSTCSTWISAKRLPTVRPCEPSRVLCPPIGCYCLHPLLPSVVTQSSEILYT